MSARARRLDSVRRAMEEGGVDALLLSHGADLPWLTGYEAMPLERLTLLVVLLTSDPVLVVPALEAPRVKVEEGLFELHAFAEGEDPVSVVAGLLGLARGATFAVSDRAWASSVLALQGALPGASWRPASTVTSPIRAVKDEDELTVLRAAGRAADRVAAALQGGEIALVGRSEAEVSAEISRRLVEEGHRRVNFAIVGSGPNGASPHHEPGRRVIGKRELVVCDFGGSFASGDDVGYCSDITRMLHTGEPSAEVAEYYEVLKEAQKAGREAAGEGVAAEEVDAAARSVIASAGVGDFFIHRTGHGIGIEEHEDPYLVEGNKTKLRPGHVFSVEPGIYFPGRFGMRLEDIVAVTSGGPEVLNLADRDLAVVEA